MADSEDDEGGSSRVFDYSTLFDDGIGEILERLDGEDKADVMDELIDGYDMPALMNMRMKIFRFAKCKLMKSLEEPGPGDLDEAYAGFVPHERIEDARKMVDEWTLIARRGKNRVVQDSLTLLSYLSGDLALFPHAVLRRKPKRKSRRGKKKNTPKKPSNKDPKQPLIPFIAGTSNDESVGPSTNDSDSDSDISSTGSSDVFDDDDMAADADDDYQSAPGGCGDDAVTNTMCEGTQVDTSPDDKTNDVTPMNVEAVPAGIDTRAPHCASDAAVNQASAGNNVPSTECADISPTAIAIGCIERAFDELHTASTSREAEQPKQAPATTCSVPRPTPSTPTSQAKTVTANHPVQPTSNAEPHCNLPSRTMSTQTEWDMWGVPSPPSSHTMSARSANIDTSTGRIQAEWRDFERRAEMKDEQQKVKLNLLRAKQIETDAEMDRMRANLDAVNKKLDDALERIQSGQCEQYRQYGMTPYMYAPSMINPPAPYLPSWLNHLGLRPREGNIAPQQATMQPPMREYSSCDVSTSGMYPTREDVNDNQAPQHMYTDPPTTTNVAAAHVATRNVSDARGPTPQAVRPKTNNSRIDDGRKGNGPDKGAVRQSTRAANGGTQVPRANASSNANSSNTPGGRATGSSVRAHPYQRSSTNAVSSGTSNQQRARVVTPRARPPTPTTTPLQNVTSDSWAEDDHISDVELVNMSDAVAPDSRQQTPKNAVPTKQPNDSRRDILESAIRVARQRDTPTQSTKKGGNGRAVQDASVSKKGESRGYDPHENGPEQNVSPKTYADAAAKEVWLSPKRRKKSGNNNAPTLEAADTAPVREIFVVNLKYANCSKPVDLENMVRDYCKDRGIKIVFAKAYPQRFDDATANCRVTVRDYDEDKVLSEGFWPCRVTARLWTPTPLFNQGKNGRGIDGANDA